MFHHFTTILFDPLHVQNMIFSEASDMIQMNSGQREPISNVISKILETAKRIEDLCSDVEVVQEMQSDSSDTGSSSDVICC